MPRRRRFAVAAVLAALAAVLAAPGARATPAFEAPSYPAEFTGTSTEGVHGFAISSTEIECEASHFEGVLEEASTTLTALPSYSGCIALGSFSATVTTTGCAFEFHLGEEVEPGVYEHSVDLVCEEGKSIVIVVVGCEILIGPQAELGGVTSTNLEGEELTVSAAVPEIHFTSKGFTCLVAGIPSTGTEGEYLDHVIVPELWIGEGEGPAPTTLTTSLSGEEKTGKEITVNEGAKIKDQATLSGENASEATGTVKYLVYSDPECKELAKSAGEVTVSGGSVPASNEVTLTAGAIYYWKAEYSGDAKNQASVSGCGEETSIVKAAVTLSTTLDGEFDNGDLTTVQGKEITVPIGAVVGDTATLSGNDVSAATGTVEYVVYGDEKCEEALEGGGAGDVEAGEAEPSVPIAAEEEGTFRWRAFYGGDALHQSAASPCDEVVTVIPPTSLETTLAGEGEEGEQIEVSVDATVTDSATLSGEHAAEATGTVEYLVYADDECEELLESAGEVEVEGATVPASEAVEIEEPGAYYWRAVYSGDAANGPSVSPCLSEIQLVLPRLTTTLSGGGETSTAIEVAAGTPVTDQASLHGEHAAEATGTVEYLVYADDECEELLESAGEVEVEGATVPASEAVEIEEAGQYYWQAEYSGDGKNPAVTTPCGDEVLFVVTPIAVTTTLSGGEEEGAEIEVEEGAAVGDQATLSGANAAAAEGVVVYTVFADEECTEPVALAGSGEVTKGAVEPSEEVTLPHGTYYWLAEYRGDGVNQDSASNCGDEIEVVTAPITTVLSGEDDEEEEVSGEKIVAAAETEVTDQATLHGEHASEANGNLEYLVYKDEECKELYESAGTVKLGGATAPASEPVEFDDPGIYYWQADYEGDEKNPEVTSTCGVEEVHVVEKGKWKYAALGDSFSSGEGVLQSKNTSYYTEETATGLYQNKCHRSPDAWPALIAGTAKDKYVETAEVFKELPDHFIFRACSGAKLTNIWNKLELDAGGQFKEFTVENEWKNKVLTSQARWLLKEGQPGKDVSVVTLTIGGNDSGFVPVIKACLQQWLPFIGYRKFDTQPCLEKIAEKKAEGFKKIETELPTILAKIREREPAAKIIISYYPYILNLEKKYIEVGWGKAFNNVDRAGLGKTAAQELDLLIMNLNLQLKAQAKKSGVKNVETRPDALLSFVGHRLGDPDNVNWINKISFWHPEESFHPNACGHREIAGALLQAVRPGAGPFITC